MENRQRLLEVINEAKQDIQALSELINSSANEKLSDILIEHFEEYGFNVGTNLLYMKMIITKINENEKLLTGEEIKLNNRELEKYFREHWYDLVSDIV